MLSKVLLKTFSYRNMLNPSYDKQIERNRILSIQNFLIFLILILGFCFRLPIFFGPFYPDESYDILAAQMIWEKGLPVFPSGSWWSTGGPLTYLESIIVGIVGPSSYLIRLPSLFFSVFSIYILYRFALKFGLYAAVFASLLWALDPEVLEWGTYLRHYSIYPFFFILFLYFCDFDKNEDRNALIKRHIYLILSLFICVWIHPPALLWLPAFIIYYLMSANGIKSPTTKIAFCLSLLAVFFLRYWLILYTDPGLILSAKLQGGSLTIPTSIKEFYHIIFSYKDYFIRFPIRSFCVFLTLFLIGYNIQSTIKNIKSIKSIFFRKENILLIFFIITIFILSFFRYNQPGYPIPLLGVLFVIGGLVFEKILVRSIKKDTQKIIILILTLSILVFFTKYDFRRNDFNEISNVYDYMANNIEAGDYIIGADPFVYLKTKERKIEKLTFYHYCHKNCGLTLMEKSNKIIDRFLGAENITSLDEIKKIFSEKKKIWWLTNTAWLQREDRYPRTINNYLFNNMKLVYTFANYNIYLFEES